MEIVAIKGQVRTDVGKKASKAVRNEGRVPCVIYGSQDTLHFTIDPKQVKPLVYTPDFKLAEVELDGASHKCIIKDIQFHPVSDAIVHIDFLSLTEGHKLKVEIPVGFEGVSPGMKLGGKLQQNLRRVKIKTTPEHLVDKLILDVSHLELGQAVRVRDLKVSDDIEIISPLGTPIASVEIPRALRSATSAEEAEEGEEAVEAEVE
ncbi:MAG: 50S ribosomal protein L25 [Saprospiraceae bacterium]|nr:50S ribosomal protein L25 [Saprospiraceae bacterium]